MMHIWCEYGECSLNRSRVITLLTCYDSNPPPWNTQDIPHPFIPQVVLHHLWYNATEIAENCTGTVALPLLLLHGCENLHFENGQQYTCCTCAWQDMG